MYNALSGNKNALSINIYNNMKLFLNLNKAGESGLLNIYRDPLNGDFTRLATYYIKNLSDDKPKFMISADFAIDTAYPALVIDYDTIDGTTVKDAILLSEDENTTTVLAYEQKQLKI